MVDLHVRHDPMNGCLCRPPIHKQPNGNQQTCRYHDGHPKLWLTNTIIALFEPSVQYVVQRSSDLSAEEEPSAHSDEVERSNACAHPINSFPETREGGEHKVHQSVQVCHVACKNLQDRLGTKQNERTLHSSSDCFGKRAVRAVELCVQGGVTGFLNELVALPGQEFGGVGLLQEEEAEALDDRGEDGCRVEAPSPGGVLGNEASRNGTDRRT
jgi:hypothetical protein